jgi:hypothetical protein
MFGAEIPRWHSTVEGAFSGRSLAALVVASTFSSLRLTLTGAIIAGPFNVTAAAGVPGGAGNGNDKEWLAIDRFVGSPFQDRIYVVWTNFLPTGGTVVQTTFSTDQGANWSPALTVSTGGEGFVWPSHNAVAANGDVYVSYHSQPTFATNAPNGTSGQIFVLRSTDGGALFPQKNAAYAGGNADITFNVQSGVRTLNQNRSWTQGAAQPWVLPDPLNAKNVYVIAGDDPTNTAHGGTNDDLNVYIVRSTDSGSTWKSPTRIDRARANNHSFFPPRRSTTRQHALWSTGMTRGMARQMWVATSCWTCLRQSATMAV